MNRLSGAWARQNDMDMTLAEWARKNGVAAPDNAASTLMRGNLYGARDMNPEQIARDETLAEALNMPSGAVALDRESAEREAAARALEQSPRLMEWAGRDAGNAAFAREDRTGLLGVLEAVAEVWNRETEALGAELDLGAMQVRYAELGNLLYDDENALGDVEAFHARMAKAQGAQDGREAWARSVGLADAVRQLPQMGKTMLPSATEAFGMGAAVWGGVTLASGGTGAAAGSVVPGAGTLLGGAGGAALGQPAAVAAGKTAAAATYLARMAQRCFYMERGAFMADIARERDSDGKPLPRAVQKAAADTYGGMSALIETGGEALFLRLLKPLGIEGKMGSEGLKTFMKSAVKRAALDRKTQRALLDFAGRLGLHALSEGTQEGLQEIASILVEEGAKSVAESAGTNLFEDRELLSAENVARVGEAAKVGAVAGAWLFAPFGGARAAIDVRDARRAREFAQAHKKLADRVAATKTRALSPARMESCLRTAGLNGDVLIPADAALELQGNGTDLAGPLGWDVRDMEEAAALGHDIVMPAARVQALLPPEQMKAVADIMRESPHAKSALEAANLTEDLPADMDALLEQAEDEALERSAVAGELERLRGEMMRAVTAAPHLMKQLASGMDAETGADRHVDAQLDLIVRRARELTRLGIPMSDTLSRFSFQGMMRDEHGRMVTPEEAEAPARRDAEEEALARFSDAVWGRLNPDSLRVEFPEARRELAYRHGRGLFAAKGEGLAVDELADELKNRGLLEEDADSSTLIERLKEMRRPDQRQMRERQ
ncbi:MAG: hypothetical protein K2O70_07960, partial [Desulfovibrionaceae bacterium]|nr:hypothetical protein [Desulfovibrionaceae bacterium]